MIPSVETQPSFTDAVKALIQIEYESLKGYTAAIKHIQNPDYKHTLIQFYEDHAEHFQALEQFLEKHPESQSSAEQKWALLPRSKQSIAHLVGDHKILQALQSNENEVLQAYQGVSTHIDRWSESEPLLRKALQDENKHSAWIAQSLKSVSSR